MDSYIQHINKCSDTETYYFCFMSWYTKFLIVLFSNIIKILEGWGLNKPTPRYAPVVYETLNNYIGKIHKKINIYIYNSFFTILMTSR